MDGCHPRVEGRPHAGPSCVREAFRRAPARSSLSVSTPDRSDVMPTTNVNIIAVVVAAVATFLLGAVWYSHALFAKQWMHAHGYTPEKVEEMKKKGVTRAYAVAAV